jgi:hypothetical protein
MENQDQFKEIVDARDYDNMVPYYQHPAPGEYVLTGIQAGNLRGERGWQSYIGYVAQVRKKAGAFGSDMILLRHPDGTMMRHENQSFFRMSDELAEKAKKLFDEGVTPEMEDYTVPYYIGTNEFPETGAIIEPNDRGPVGDNSPLVQITVCDAGGTKILEVC